MQFWKDHTALRVGLIALCFAAGIALVVLGWRMTGKLAGLGLMLVGVVLLLIALAIYNKPFEEPRQNRRNR